MNKYKSFWASFGAVLLVSGGLLGVISLWFSGGAAPLQAAPNTIWYVDAGSGDDDNNDCLSPGTACATIETAVAKASADDTIQIAAGTYLEHDITIYQLTLLGAGAGSTIIDANYAGRAFQFSGSSTLSGVTIQHGQVVTDSSIIFDTSGGAILASGSLTIEDSVLINNNAQGNGGAIFNNGDLIINNTQILSNTTEANGGGIYNYTSGGITMTHSLVAENVAEFTYGGGIYATQPIYLHNVTVRDNSAGSFGGGLVTDDQATLDGVTLQGNEAASGAAFFAYSGEASFTNVTVSGNTASNNYGGLYISGPSTVLTLQNSTIANNGRTGSAGTGFNGLFIGNNATVSIVNAILAGNDDLNCGGTAGNWTSLGYNLADDSSCAFTQTGDEQGIDPLLQPLGDYGGETLTHALLPGSPAIDSGTNAACPATDQRGVARPYDGDNDGTPTCDKGAYEAQHQLTIADVMILEGNGGTTTAVFTVTLAPTNTQTVTVDYATIAGTATEGVDYTAVADTLTFNSGESTQYIMVDVIGDTGDEPDETFTVQLSNPSNAELVDGLATGTIVDDDGLPALTIADESVLEGNSSTVNMLFTVQLSPPSPDTVTVDYTTVAGTAEAGVDYTAVADTLTFNPGETSQQITVTVLGDIIDEGISENFTVQLSGAVNANLEDAAATGTITDDDSARLSHNYGPHIPEGNSGLTPAVFTVTLSTPAAFTITVDYEVSSGYGEDGATLGVDFLATPGTLTFLPGETVKTYTVDVVGDMELEADEYYSSLISNANVPITVNGSPAAILNDDGYLIYLPTILR
ncbi:MAG: hypothetical protein H6662_07045 [Ardenticatenaceae bacterium]|nr:hypothetical protein [Ardenticatenaceae bacterium]MCB8990685.1 hypothetical protein [Ardenticatenaceae bacterium]MCB9004054.1 hypothetical protein [Ardenticatenaceae bacterium]